MAFDEIQGLGKFVEFELVVAEDDLDSATALLTQLSASLGLGESITTGYLDMLLR